MPEFIFGRNAVLEAAESGFPLRRIMVASTHKDRERMLRNVRRYRAGIEIALVDKRVLEKLSKGARTGGICAEIEESVWNISVDSFLNLVKKSNPIPLLLAVDGIQDPGNFGAVIRSAVGAGFNGIIFPKDRQTGVTGVVAASSAGSCFRIPMCRVTNLARTLDRLKDAGFWIYGTEAGASTSVYEADYVYPLVLVVGSEEKGMRPLVSKKCDEIVSIPLRGGLESLNVSVAAGIAMFEIARKNQLKFRKNSEINDQD